MMRFFFAALFCVSMLICPISSADTLLVGEEFSGAWFDESHNGEGFLLEILDSERAVVYWFTYDTEGNQRWFIGVGEVVENSVVFENLIQPTGARFGAAFDPADVVRSEIGTLSVEFSDCNSGTASYVLEGVAGSQQLGRLTGIAGHDCHGIGRNSNVLLSGVSGSWYEPSRSGEGFVIEIIGPESVLLFWFTFDDKGAQAWHFGTGSVASGVLSIDSLVTTQGGKFGEQFDPANVERIDWGQLQIQIECDRLDYQYTSRFAGSGARSMQQLTQVGKTTCLDGADFEKRLDEMLSAQIDSANFEYGASYAVENEISGRSWSGVAGTAAAPGSGDLTQNHAFVAGDLGTFVTAALAMRLVEQDLVALDAAVTNYLPVDLVQGLTSFEGVDHTPFLTVRHLLNHRSGLPDLFQAPADGSPALIDVLLERPQELWSSVEVIEFARQNLRATFRPGSDVQFNEFNSVLLGEIIEAVTGESLNMAFRRLIADPAGMQNTWSFSRDAAPAGTPVAALQVAENDITQLPAVLSIWAGSDWVMTKSDLGRFMHGIFEGKLLRPETVDLMVSPQSNYIGAAHLGLGAMTRLDDCSLPDAAIEGFLGGGSFALYVPERRSYFYGFASRVDYFGLGYAADVLQSHFGSGACIDAGNWSTDTSSLYSSDERRALDDQLAGTAAAAMLVVHQGSVVYEFGQIGRRYATHSIRKSFVGALYGNEVAGGLIDMDATMADLNIDDLSPLTPVERLAEVRHLLQSRSGIYHPAAGTDDEARNDMLPRGGVIPGSSYYYNNWDFNVAGTIYENATGQSVFDRFISDIANPIGMEDIERRDQFYLFERLVSQHPVYWFTLTARDMARFGQLYLQHGQWGDQQVIPSEWITDSTRSYSETGNPDRPGFGYMNWSILNNGYMATGSGGHKILVLPQDETVVVLRVDTYNDDSRVSDATFFQIVDNVLTAQRSR